jgi:hypothetical protein
LVIREYEFATSQSSSSVMQRINELHSSLWRQLSSQLKDFFGMRQHRDEFIVTEKLLKLAYTQRVVHLVGPIQGLSDYCIARIGKGQAVIEQLKEGYDALKITVVAL